MGSEYIPAALASNEMVTLAGTVSAAAGIGGPVADVVVGLAQLVTVFAGEYFRLRAIEAQMSLSREQDDIRLRGEDGLPRHHAIDGGALPAGSHGTGG